MLAFLELLNDPQEHSFVFEYTLQITGGEDDEDYAFEYNKPSLAIEDKFHTTGDLDVASSNALGSSDALGLERCLLRSHLVQKICLHPYLLKNASSTIRIGTLPPRKVFLLSSAVCSRRLLGTYRALRRIRAWQILILVDVPVSQQASYHARESTLAQNVVAACHFNNIFAYVLTG